MNRASYLASVRLPTWLLTLLPTQFTHKLAHKTGVEHNHQVLLICQCCFRSLIWVHLLTSLHINYLQMLYLLTEFTSVLGLADMVKSAYCGVAI